MHRPGPANAHRCSGATVRAAVSSAVGTGATVCRAVLGSAVGTAVSSAVTTGTGGSAVGATIGAAVTTGSGTAIGRARGSRGPFLFLTFGHVASLQMSIDPIGTTARFG